MKEIRVGIKNRRYNLFPTLLVLCLLVGGFACSVKDHTDIPPAMDLVVGEGFTNPIGFYDNQPSFSWKLPVDEKIKSQTAYRLVVASNPDLLHDEADLWDTKKVNSDRSVWVKYEGHTLESRQKVWWKVMYWDQEGNASPWSDVATFELGLLSNADWEAKWIYLQPKTELNKNSVYQPQYLRKEFTVNDTIQEARLYITSRGVFEAQINGIKVGEDIMTPGWTPYKKRIETLSYDVSQLIEKGNNAIGVMIGQGWFWGRINYFNKKWEKKSYPAAICQLEVRYWSGKTKIIKTDTSWIGTDKGPIKFSGIYDGEEYNANLEMPGWSNPGFNSGEWEHVVQEDIGSEIQLSPKRHNPVRDKEILLPVAITKPEPGKLVFDLGQNMVGVPEIRIPVKKNQKVIIRFAEMLKKDGTLYTENYRSAKSTDFYIPNADGIITWRPTFTFHGFRYVELSGFDTGMDPARDWIKGIVQYSDFQKLGSFSSSNKKLNKLQSNISWGLKGNFLDVPTDCPQRDERMGWTGDAQVFTPTSIFNSSVYSFWASWLKSMREEQLDDGSIPIVIPSNRSYKSSAGWSDAATVIPWELYLRTGDKKVLEENYSMMKRWVEFCESVADSRATALMPLGDWLQPYSQNKEDNKRGETPQELVETAYYAYSIQLLLQTAEVLGHQEDSKWLKLLLDDVKKEFVNNFYDSNGKLTTEFETQTGYLLALGFDLVSHDLAQKMVPHLVRKINDADNHLRTGFLGTPLLAPVLHKYGQTDLMYSILLKETYPSWFYSINQGATTIWERWNSYSHEDGFGDAAMNSFNHYAYGAIGQWMYESIAGISPLEPGYKKIRIAPTPGGGLDYANAEYNSMFGKIYSGWNKTEGGLEMKVVIPPNTTGMVYIPMEKSKTLFLIGKEFETEATIKMIDRTENSCVLEVLPGTYSFKTKTNN